MDDGQQYIDHFCHYDPPLGRHLMCSRFYFAKARKEIVPNYRLGCWIMPDDPLRRSTFEATQAVGEDHRNEDYQRWDCPWCGGETSPVRKNEPRILPRSGEPTSDPE